jgi:putative aldouronate transport system permease protein
MKNKIKSGGTGYRVFQIINFVIMLIVIVTTLYPFLYLLAISFSNNTAVLTNKVWLYPVNFTTGAYQSIMSDMQFWTGYKNTLIYTILGTFISLAMTVICAYPLSKKGLPGRGILLKFIVFTMYFGGGMIPSYLLIMKMNLMNTIWSIVVPGAISAYNMIVMKTFFEGIPESLEEAAMIDGLGYIRTLIKIVLPLSMPVLATITLFYAVGFWNDWFNALIYLNDSDKLPVTLYLRNLLSGAQMAAQSGQVISNGQEAATASQTLQAATVMLVTIPIICVYPFLQKYFVKGVMIGSVKG